MGRCNNLAKERGARWPTRSKSRALPRKSSNDRMKLKVNVETAFGTLDADRRGDSSIVSAGVVGRERLKRGWTNALEHASKTARLLLVHVDKP